MKFESMIPNRPNLCTTTYLKEGKENIKEKRKSVIKLSVSVFEVIEGVKIKKQFH